MVKRRFFVWVDEETLTNLRRKMDGNSLANSVRKYLMDLESGLPEPEVTRDVKRIPLTCSRCGHKWVYKGTKKRADCSKCGKHVRTGVKLRKVSVSADNKDIAP